MKNITKAAICIAFIVAMAVSFIAGSMLNEQRHIDGRAQRCGTLISFAIDKAESYDLSDPNVMEALVSNIYAAYELCDDPNVSAQLHDLWNDLIFEGGRYIGNEDALADQLRTILETLRSN